MIDAGAAALARVPASPVVARARREAAGELRYYVDELQLRAAALGATLGVS